MDAKQATQKALEYANELLGNSARDLRLEEVDRSGGVWKITLSWEERAAAKGMLSQINGTPREFKVFSIDDATGQMVSMKLRSA
jgi:hypothetical protein